MVDPNPFVIDVSEATFRRDVLERSFHVPVLVDFWAEWCGPCKSLTPLLEAVAARMAGRFVLAKVDTDKNPQLVQQLGVRGVPTVKAVVDGKVVDGFTGAVPEQKVIEFVDKVSPSPTDKLLDKIIALKEAGDVETAFSGLTQILQQEPNNMRARVQLAEILLDNQQLDDAKKIIGSVTSEDEVSAELAVVLSRMKLMDEVEPIEPLREALTADPENIDAKVALGKALISQGCNEEGLELLLEAVRGTSAADDKRARDAMVQVFEALGSTAPLVLRYRSKLSMLLFK